MDKCMDFYFIFSTKKNRLKICNIILSIFNYDILYN